jgi:putative DNA primase/helicase
MTMNKPNPLIRTLSGQPFRSQPEVPSQSEQIEQSHLPAIDPDTANVTNVLSPQTATSQDAPPLPNPLSLAEPTAIAGCADLVYFSDLQLQPVQWLWQDRLASGTLAMISGVPGSGKTWVALAIAAALSRGRVPATGETSEPCNVLYASMEHGSSEIIHPRFVRLQGDPTRFVVLRGAVSAPSASLNLRDTSVLEDALHRTHARLLILDSFSSYTPAGVDLLQPTEALPILEKLARLAERHRCCILLVCHLSKRGPCRLGFRSPGSIEISAALRTEFLAGSSPDAPSQPALLQVKSNLGPLAPALAYKIDDAGNFSWTGLSKITREEMLADRPTEAGLPKRKFAGDWLRQYLQDGSKSQFTIETAADRDGVGIATLRRAKFDLGVRSAKDGVNGAWYWSLPVAGEQQQPPKQAR